MRSKHLAVFLLGLGTACQGSGEYPQDVLDRADLDPGETLEDRASHASIVVAEPKAASSVPLKVLAVHTDGEDLAPEQPLLEMIQTAERFSEIVTTLGAKAGFGLPHADGSRWYPEVDFENEVVFWIYQGLDNIGASFADFSATMTADAVTLSFTVGPRSCVTLSADGYPYAFVKLPRVGKPYQLSPSRPVLDCPE